MTLYHSLSSHNSEEEETPRDAPNRMLSALIKTAQENCKRKKNGYRYNDEIVRKFGALMFLLGGRLQYEILQEAIGLPSVPSISIFIKNASAPVIEGEFRFEELKSYLSNRGLPPLVWISEDGTSIVNRIRYDPARDCIFGFKLPLDRNSCPIEDSFPASSAEVIQKYFKEEAKCNYAYCVMAQPISTAYPAFCLAIFGTNNRFTSSDVIARWKWISKKAKEHGITVLGYSSDADTRLLKAMRQETFQPECDNPLAWEGWVVQEIVQDRSFIQDPLHIGTKLKTRLTKQSVVMPMGRYQASSEHIRALVNSSSKLDHRLSILIWIVQTK